MLYNDKEAHVFVLRGNDYYLLIMLACATMQSVRCHVTSLDDSFAVVTHTQASDGIMDNLAQMIQQTTSTGQIQVVHATPEQVAQLQQTHQIHIVQGDHVIGP